MGGSFVRFEAARPNAAGVRLGVFALANGLARSGCLTAEEWAWWRANNDWFNAAYADPGLADPSLFDRGRRPRVSCWFKISAAHLFVRVPGYLELLDRYGIAWVELRFDDPGRVLYEDDVQVVVSGSGS